MGKAGKEKVWMVRHPGHEDVRVVASDWQLATVEAAAWWGVPWKKVAAECEAWCMGEVLRNVCTNCGKIFHAEGLLCESCAHEARTREMNRRANEKRFWRDMSPKKSRLNSGNSYTGNGKLTTTGSK